MTSFSISFVFKGRELNFVHVTGSIFFQSLHLTLKNRIFESKSNCEKLPKYSSMEPHQPYLSFLFCNFLNKP